MTDPVRGDPARPGRHPGEGSDQPAGSATVARPRSPVAEALTRFGPWLVAIAILVFFLARIPIDEVVAALAQVTIAHLILVAVLFIVGVISADSLAIWVALRAAAPDRRLPYGAILRVRGASALFALISYAAGQGGVVYLLRRYHGLAVSTGAGAILLATGAFLIAVAVAISAGVLAGALPERGELTAATVAMLAGSALYLVIIRWRPRRLLQSRWLSPFFTAGVLGTLRVTGVRSVHLAILMAGHFTAMWLFGIEVPISVALAGLPVLFLVAALPISPSGLGTTQAAAITLFSSFAPGSSEQARQATVLAYSLAFQVTGTLVVAIVGMICLRSLQTIGPQPSTQ